MQEKAKQWQTQGLYLQFMPAYCPSHRDPLEASEVLLAGAKLWLL